MAKAFQAVSHVRVMGVLNVTPDSFSDGGRFIGHDAALAQARRLIADGADVLDIGAESTRPRATPVGEAEELDRLIPVVEAIRAESDIVISADTMKPAVARAAVAAGASIWNDVTALRWSPDSAATAADLGCEVVLMHMLGEPGSMQDDPRYDDVLAEVADFLRQRADAAIAAGVGASKLWLDPGVGFGKTVEHNLALIAGLEHLTAIGYPVVLGVSRKRFIAALDPRALSADDRLGGSVAAALAGVRRGARMVRVHDVRQTVQALAVQAAIEGVA